MKTESSRVDPPAGDEGPLQDFSRCHQGIIDHFERLRGLPVLLADRSNFDEARRLATDTCKFFRDAVIEHHGQEEQELFPAVIRRADPGDEAGLAKSLVHRLTDEHRQLEATWKKLEPTLRALGKGKEVEIDAPLIEQFAAAYLGHARFEEAAFLPLSAKILDRYDQAALGVQIHMRHALDRIVGYI